MYEDWYRKTFGENNPLALSSLRQKFDQLPQPRLNWQPPSAYNYQINRQYDYNPNAAQDLQNLLGNFFTQNYTPQPQPLSTQTYQTDPKNYTAYQPSPIRNDNPNAWQDLQNGAGHLIDKYVTPQLAQGITYAAGVGIPLYAAIRHGRNTAVPYSLAMLGAMRYGAPLVNGLRKFGETPVGKFADKALDKVINLLW